MIVLIGAYVCIAFIVTGAIMAERERTLGSAYGYQDAYFSFLAGTVWPVVVLIRLGKALAGPGRG